MLKLSRSLILPVLAAVGHLALGQQPARTYPGPEAQKRLNAINAIDARMKPFLDSAKRLTFEGKFADAERKIQVAQAISAEPGGIVFASYVRFAEGHLLLAEGHYQEAIRTLEPELSHGVSEDAGSDLALAYVGADQPQKALDLLAKISVVKDDRAGDLFREANATRSGDNTLALALYVRGSLGYDDDPSLADLMAAHRLLPKNPCIACSIGDHILHKRQTDFARALPYYQLASDNSSGPMKAQAQAEIWQCLSGLRSVQAQKSTKPGQ